MEGGKEMKEGRREKKEKAGMVAHGGNSGTWGVEAEQSVQSQPGLHSKQYIVTPIRLAA